MRALFAICVGLATLATAAGQGADKDKLLKRYNLFADPTKYPQDTPQKALGSVVKALENGEVDYLLAHLAEAQFVDSRVAELAKALPGKVNDEGRTSLAFQQLLKETKEHFQNDPTRFKELARFAKDGEYMAGDKGAVVSLKTVPIRKVFLKKSDGRWYIEDREK